jgi:hypothetical protein
MLLLNAFWIFLHNAISLAIGFVLMSFIEYATHRWMLHKNLFVRWFPRAEIFQEVLRDHAVNHHGHFYKCFNNEADPEGKYTGLFFPLGYYQLLMIFITVPMLFVDWVTAVYFSIFVVAHYVGWNQFHKAMHFDEKPWRLWKPWFTYVEYCHYLHHQHRNKNFNGFLPPVWDVLLGTKARETDEDREVWRLMQEGQVVDRKGRPLQASHP